MLAARPLDATVTVSFSIHRKLNFGQQVVLVGNTEALGAWQLERAAALSWSEGDTWRASLEVPAATPFEYKFVVVEEGCAPVWETCGNRSWKAEVQHALLACEWESEAVEPTVLESTAAEAAARQSLANRRDAVSAVGGAMAAASGATAAAEAVVAAAEAAAAAVSQAVAAAEAVVQELTAAGGATALKVQAVNAGLADAHFSPEQLAFLQRKRSVSPASRAAPAPLAHAPAQQQTAAAAAEAVLAATTAAAGAAAKVVEVAESVAAELGGAAVAGRAGLPDQAGNYTPDQLAFMRRKLNAIQAQPSAVKPTHGDAARPASVPQGNYTPEQLAFLQRKRSVQQPSAAAASQPKAAAAATQYSPEQIAFLRRSGKL